MFKYIIVLFFINSFFSTNCVANDRIYYLINNSELISIVDIYEKENKFFGIFPSKKHARAKIVNIFKGSENGDSIIIFNQEKIPDKGSEFTFINFKRGLNFVFLCKDNNGYNPTDGDSVLDISNNRVFPDWDYRDGYGTPLNEFLETVEGSLRQSNYGH